MKFRDPKTGEAFDSLDPKFIPIYGSYEIEPAEAARLMGYEIIEDEKEANMEKKDKPLGEWTLKEVQSYCLGRSTMCDGCQFMGIHCSGDPTGWTIDDQSCAKDTNVGHNPAKPRLAEVLGVEVGERFTMRDGNIELPGLYVEKDGTLYERDGTCTSGSVYSFLINHPERIIRAPRLTEAELVICKAVGAKYIARDKDSPWVTLHLEKPEPLSTGCYSFKGYIGTLDENLFPSVALGDCICVEEADT